MKTAMKAWMGLAAIFLLALAVRAAIAVFVPEIGYLDVIYFDFECARAFARGEYLGGFLHWVPPLYPLLLSLPFRALQEMEVSGRIVSVLLGALTVFPAYGIGRQLAGRKAGLVAALVLALQSFHVDYSVEVSSHAAYTFFFAIAAWLGIRVVRAPGWRRAIAFAAAAGAAYWVRQEVTSLVLFTGAALALREVVRVIRRRDDPKPFAAFGSALAAGAVFAALIFPIVYGTYAKTGRWTLSSKQNASYFAIGRHLNVLTPDRTRILWETRITTMEDYRPLDWRNRAGEYARKWASQLATHLAKNFPRAFGYILLPFAILALIRRRVPDRSGIGDLFFACFIAFNVAILSLFYDSPRLLLSLTPIVAAWTAIGMLEAGAWIKPARIVLIVAILQVPLLVHLPARWGFSLAPSPEEVAGRWIAKHLGAGHTIMDPNGNIAYYACGKPVVLPVASAEDILYYARHRAVPVEILAYRRNAMLRHRAPVVEAIERGDVGGIELVHTIDGDDPVLIYRIGPAGQS
ncbi:MAG: glycosyltransferase family 39 protein [Planctomycetes bacterium]|nr:glycosyltransferase family 39 protein [Planctomycetota bacterium]